MNDHKLLFRSDMLWKSSMLQDALREAGIPFYLQEGNVSGITFSPGTQAHLMEHLVFVPENLYDKANEVLESLPFDKEEVTTPLNLQPQSNLSRKIIMGFIYYTLLAMIIPVVGYILVSLYKYIIRK